MSMNVEAIEGSARRGEIWVAGGNAPSPPFPLSPLGGERGSERGCGARSGGFTPGYALLSFGDKGGGGHIFDIVII